MTIDTKLWRDNAEFLSKESILALIDALEEARAALREIARQKLESEMEDHEADGADWQCGYEEAVKVARKAVP
jgi:hypothetical protein